jgi:hypothetical protein
LFDDDLLLFYIKFLSVTFPTAMQTTHPHPTHLPGALRGWVFSLRLLTLLGALALAVVPLWFWSEPEWVRASGRSLVGLLPEAPLTVDSRALWLGLAASLPGVLLGAWALWALWRLLKAYAQGRFFEHEARQCLRRFAWALLLMALWVPLQKGLFGVALTLGNPPGQRMLVLGLGWSDYLSVLVSVVLLTVAQVQAEAARLAEENAGFV